MSLVSGNSSHQNRPPRPFSVTLLAFGVLTIAGLNLTRFIEAIILRGFLAEFPAVPVLYLALSGLFWGSTAVPLGYGLWTGRRWARNYMIIYALGYSAFFWVDRLFSGRRTITRNFPFVLGANLILLLITWWIISRRTGRAFFGEEHEERPKNPAT